MPLNLPNNPTIGQTVTEGSRAWFWNGRYWQATSLNVGFTGSKGDTGFTGSKGEQGNFGGVTLDYTYSDDTDSTIYPGAGRLKFNTRDMTQAESLIIADSDDNAINLDNYFATIDASTSEIRGHFKVTKKSYPEYFVMFAITAEIDSFDDYYVIPCNFVSGNLTDSSTTFEAEDDILITFARTGDKGEIGFTGSVGFTGSQGPIGSSIDIKGSVETPQDLPQDGTLDGSTLAQPADGLIVNSTGELYIWDGEQWNNAGRIVGPTGFTGSIGGLGYTGSQGEIGYSGSEGESSFYWGDTPPENPEVGSRWYDTAESILLVYVDDGDSQQWVEVAASGYMGQTGYTGSGAYPSLANNAGSVLVNDGNNVSWSAGSFMFRNKIINGNFDIWQRGTSTTSSAYLADRWWCQSSGSTKTASREAFDLGQTDVPNNPKYFMRHVVTTGGAADDYVTLRQNIEGAETLSGKTATLSFWAKADASKNIAVEFGQWFGTGGSPSSYNSFSSQLVALTTSWTKYTITVDVPSVSGKTLGTDNNDFLGLYIWPDAGSNYDSRTTSLGNQSGTFDIAQVQLEEGSVATPFEMRPPGVEGQLCMRYYQYCGTSSSTGPLCPLYMGTSTSARFQWPLTVPMRNNPSIEIVSGTPFARYPNSGFTGLVVNNITSFPSSSVGGGDKNCMTSVGFVVTVATGIAGGTGVFAGAVIAYFDAEL